MLSREHIERGWAGSKAFKVLGALYKRLVAPCVVYWRHATVIMSTSYWRNDTLHGSSDDDYGSRCSTRDRMLRVVFRRHATVSMSRLT